MRVGSLFRANPRRPGSSPSEAPRAPQHTVIMPELEQRPAGVSGEAWQRARTWSSSD